MLLDTCAVIWLAAGSFMSEVAVTAIVAAGLERNVYVSPASAWEIGLLARPKTDGTALRFMPDPKAWFTKFMAGPGIRLAPLTPEIAIDSSHLPGTLHGDPADRLIIATARHVGATIVTRDRRIVAYADEGHIHVLTC